MDNIFLTLINMSITASWTALAVVILRLLLKKAPKAIICVLWALVGVRLVLPFSIESVLSLVPSVDTVPLDIVYAKEPKIHTGISYLNTAVNPIITESFAPPNTLTSINPIQVWLFIAEQIWAIGIVTMLIYTAYSYIKLRTRVREAVKLDGVWLCDRIDTPFILGVIRPKIYIPSSMSESDIEYVVAHEKAHIRRRDYIWKPLGFALLTVYWFNPVLWLAYILLCRDIESACDEKVLREKGTEIKKAYSDALINASVPRKLISACPLAFGETSVKSRVKSVLNYKKPAFWIVIVALIICIAVAVCFLTNPIDNTFKGTPLVFDGTESYVFYASKFVYGVKDLVDDKSEFRLYGDMTFASEGCEGLEEDGKMSEITLKEDNFDIFFKADGKKIAQKIRENNRRAWMIDCDTVHFLYGETRWSNILLEQNNGTYYLLYVGYGPDSNHCWFGKVKKHTIINNITNNSAAPLAFDKEGVYLFYPEELVYDAPMFDYVMTVDAAPDYRLRGNLTFEEMTDDKINTLGTMQETTLTQEFDALFDLSGKSFSAEVRKNNHRAWELYVPTIASLRTGDIYMLLEQKDGTYYICIGYTYEDNQNSLIRWVYRVNKEQKSYGGYNIYKYHNSPDPMEPSIMLYDEPKIFSFGWSGFSSYMAIGKYELDEHTLTLKTDDGLNTYVFDVVGDTYVFDASRSSMIPSYKYSADAPSAECPVPDGAVFEFDSYMKDLER